MPKKAASDGKTWEKNLAKILMTASDVPVPNGVIDTGSLTLNLNLKWGGFPRGSLVRIWGEPTAGKSTLAHRSIANDIAAGKRCAWIDSETDINPLRMKANGIDTDKLTVWRYTEDAEIPMTYENMFVMIYYWIKAGYDTIVVDSIDSIPTKAMLEGDPGDKFVGGRGLINSVELSKLKGLCAARNATVIFIQQIRAGIGDMSWGDTRHPSGGYAMEHNCAVEVKLVIGANIPGEESGSSLGHYTNFDILRNKNTTDRIRGKFAIRNDYGIDLPTEIIEYGIEFGLIQKTVGWHSFIGYTLASGDPARINGKEAARQWLISEPSIMLQLYDKILELAK